MSQAKVDKYKEYKKNRKENIAKEQKAEKRSKMLTNGVLGLLALCLVAGVGVKAYSSYQEALAARPDYKLTAFGLADMAGILEEETEAETE